MCIRVAPCFPLNFAIFKCIITFLLGAMIGHEMPQGQLTVPIGVLAEIDADAGIITLLEAAVISKSS